MAYKVPFVDFPAHYHSLEKEMMDTVKEIFEGGDYILRKHLKQFESDMASFLGVKYAVGLNSGTDALHFSLLAAGVVPGDEVITVAHTFVATVEAIIHCGAKPILVDVCEDFNMDVELVKLAISSKTKVIIPVHLNGRLCDMGKLMEIADKYNLTVVEDSAQALGATFDGKKAGSFGLTGCFSFYPAKILGGAGDGGILVTDDEAVAEKIRLLRDHGMQRSTGEILYFGYNSRLDNLQAAILDLKLKHLPNWIERRRKLASLYYQGLSGLVQVKPPPHHDSDSRYFDVFTNYVIRAQDRDKLITYLKESGIEVLISWSKPLHHHKALELGNSNLPETERISKEVVSLPLNTEISNDQVEFVTGCIHKFYEG